MNVAATFTYRSHAMIVKWSKSKCEVVNLEKGRLCADCTTRNMSRENENGPWFDVFPVERKVDHE